MTDQKFVALCIHFSVPHFNFEVVLAIAAVDALDAGSFNGHDLCDELCLKPKRFFVCKTHSIRLLLFDSFLVVQSLLDKIDESDEL